MDITILIDLLPDSVKTDVVDFNDVLLKNRKNAIRVLMDRILTEEEKQKMKKNKHFMGVDWHSIAMLQKSRKVTFMLYKKKEKR